MDFWQGLLLISGIHLLAAASPGPDFVLVSQQALTKGRKVGLLCSLGITLGLSIHIIYSVLGLATVIAHSHWLLMGIKILGGCYLLYLGMQGIRSKAKPVTTLSDVQQGDVRSGLGYIKQGFLCNVFNPKAPVYFVSVFTLVLSPDMPFWQLCAYGMWMMVLQMIWFGAVTLLLSTPMINQRFQKISHWVDRVMGTAMMGLGLNLIFRKTS